MVDRWDGLALVGLALLAVGLWMVAPALAFIVIGALLVAFSVIGSRNGAGE